MRAAALLAAALAATEGLRLVVLPPLLRVVGSVADGRPVPALPFDQLVTAGCALAVLACWTWWLVAGLVLALDVLRYGAVSAAGPRRGCPTLVRVVVLAALGAGIGAAPATAHPVGAEGARRSATAPGLVGLGLPDRVDTVVVPRARERATVRVRPGDSLWAIAARRLPAGATDLAVAHAWQRLAAANLPRIGDDPDLIFPGTVLRVPDLGTPPGKEPS